MCHFLSIDALAKQIGLSACTVRRLAKKGVIPAIRPSGGRGKLLFCAEDVEAALRALTEPAG